MFRLKSYHLLRPANDKAESDKFFDYGLVGAVYVIAITIAVFAHKSRAKNVHDIKLTDLRNERSAVHGRLAFYR